MPSPLKFPEDETRWQAARHQLIPGDIAHGPHEEPGLDSCRRGGPYPTFVPPLGIHTEKEKKRTNNLEIQLAGYL